MNNDAIWITIVGQIIVGLIVAVIGKFWVDSKIEKLKCSISERLFSHNLLFEKEFKIYQELWGKLEKFRCSIAQLNSPFVLEKPDKSIEDIKQEKLHKLVEDFIAVDELVKINKPFFAPEVYKEVWEIIKIAIGQIGTFHFPQEDIVKRYKQAEDAAQVMLKITDKIEKAIRNRLFSVKSQT